MLKQFIRHLEKKGKSPRTIAQYQSMLTKFFKTYPENPAKITMAMVDTLRNNGRSTSHAYLSCMRSYLRFAQSEGIETIDTKKIYLPGIEQTRVVALTKEQVDAMIDAWATPVQKALVAFLFSTGLRISEALALRRDELKPEMQVRGKWGKIHTIFLSDSATKLVSQYIHSRTDRKTALWVTEGWEPMNYTYAYRMIGQLWLDAWVPFHVTPHVLRHSLATYLIEQGVDSRYIQEMLDHASIATTMRYAHATPMKLRSIHREILQ